MTDMVLTTLMIYKEKKITKTYTAKTTQRREEGISSREKCFIRKQPKKKQTNNSLDDFAFAILANIALVSYLDNVQQCICIRQCGWSGCQTESTEFCSSFSFYHISNFYFLFSFSLSIIQQSNIEH